MLIDNNYYNNDNNWKYMPVSQYKDFMSCEAKVMPKLNRMIPEKNTEAFLAGNYVDSAFIYLLQRSLEHDYFLFRKRNHVFLKI